ncbi:hypothetical protein E2562_036870 [Oryza meyeriana var. granulata]|uniref:Uncharacterized protein n=1 Tax=Oryza meyeriana var. granulata TaxID=110450 RepID=A0A6G1CXE9_9ORYZ|nr:hypothetical protein E2562_036870 [Oryza meyeriana var. granulata]
MEEVVLLGWPPQSSESASTGNVSFIDRTYDMICDLDFNMTQWPDEEFNLRGKFSALFANFV